MKLLKYIVFLLLIALISGAIYVATLEGTFRVKKEFSVKAPIEVVYKEINDFKHWQQWNFWTGEGGEISVNPNDSTFSYKAKNLPDGRIVTVKSIPHQIIRQQLYFQTDVGTVMGKLTWKFRTQDEKTRVQLTISGQLNFWEKAYRATQDSTYISQVMPLFDRIFKSIEKNVIKQISQFEIQVKGKIKRDGFYYLYKTTSARNRPESLRQSRKELAAEVKAFMTKHNILGSGNSLLIYNSLKPENNSAIISVGYPLVKNTPIPKNAPVLKAHFKSGMYLKTVLKGNYSHSKEAWNRAERWLETHKFKRDSNRARVELFVQTAKKYPNPAKWLTELYWPIGIKMPPPPSPIP